MGLDQAWIAEEEARKERRIRAWIKWCKTVPEDAFVDVAVDEDIRGTVPWSGYYDFISISGGTSSLNIDTKDDPTSGYSDIEKRRKYQRDYMRRKRSEQEE